MLFTLPVSSASYFLFQVFFGKETRLKIREKCYDRLELVSFNSMEVMIAEGGVFI